MQNRVQVIILFWFYGVGCVWLGFLRFASASNCYFSNISITPSHTYVVLVSIGKTRTIPTVLFQHGQTRRNPGTNTSTTTTCTSTTTTSTSTTTEQQWSWCNIHSRKSNLYFDATDQSEEKGKVWSYVTPPNVWCKFQLKWLTFCDIETELWTHQLITNPKLAATTRKMWIPGCASLVSSTKFQEIVCVFKVESIICCYLYFILHHQSIQFLSCCDKYEPVLIWFSWG